MNMNSYDTTPLEIILNEWQWHENLDILGAGLHDLHLLWANWLALAHDLLTLKLGITLLDVVGLDALQEVLVAPGLAHVLDAYVEAFAELAATDDLVHLNTNSVAVDVEDDAAAAVVEAVWHTLLDGWVDDDVNIITTLELVEVAGEARRTLGLVCLRELVTRAMTVTPRLRTSGTHGFSEGTAQNELEP